MDAQEFIYGVEKLRKDLFQQARHYVDNAEDAEDAVQETLLKLWINRERIADASKMRNFATVICRNISLNMLRTASNSIPIEDVESATMTSDPLTQLEERESRQKLKQSIHALSDKHRAILKMRNVDNMSYTDIARILGTSESSVRGMISKARLELVKMIKGTVL